MPWLNHHIPTYYQKKSHKLYSILRRAPFYELVVSKHDPSKVSSSGNNNNGSNNNGSNNNGGNGLGSSFKTEFEISSSDQRVYTAVINEQLNKVAIVTNSTTDRKIRIVLVSFDNMKKRQTDTNGNGNGNGNILIGSGHSMDDTVWF